MSKMMVHIINLVLLLLLLSFNMLALFGAGMSQGGVGFEMWFTAFMGFLFWIIFYTAQLKSSKKHTRTILFLVLVTILLFWETGLGVEVGSWFVM